jgi:DNA-binding transcriptional LysR family regulator
LTCGDRFGGTASTASILSNSRWAANGGCTANGSSLRRSNGSIAPWSFLDGNKAVEAIVSGPLIAHDYPTLIGAAIQGVGLAQVPGPLTASPISAGRLQALLTPFAVTMPGIFLYHPGRRRSYPSCAFIDHVRSRSNVANKTRIHVDDRRARPRKRG